MKVIGILVCQSQAVLDHKLTDGKKANGRYCYWDFGSRFPTRIKQATQTPKTASGYDGVYEWRRIPGIGKGVVSEAAPAPVGFDDVNGSDPQAIRKAPVDEYDGIYEDNEVMFEKYGLHVRFYFAVGGVVKGYFKSLASNIRKTQIRFYSEDWVPIRNGPKIKPSQGFRYFDLGKKA